MNSFLAVLVVQEAKEVKLVSFRLLQAFTF
jgi:hypothetical protein